MELNVATNFSYSLENKEYLKNAANNILNKNGATTEITQNIIEKTLFEGDRLLKEQSMVLDFLDEQDKELKFNGNIYLLVNFKTI